MVQELLKLLKGCRIQKAEASMDEVKKVGTQIPAENVTAYEHGGWIYIADIKEGALDSCSQ